MKRFFPAPNRIVGAVLALTGLFGYCVAATEGLINVYRIVLPEYTLADGSYPYPSDFWEVNGVFGNVSLCIMILGLVTLFFTTESDEYFYKLRLESIQFAVYAQFLVGLTAFAYFYFTPDYQIENTFQAIAGMVCATFVIAYTVRYYAGVYLNTGQD